MDDLYLHADSDYIIHVHSYVKLGWLAGWILNLFAYLSQLLGWCWIELDSQY